jgi:hypothetical protein
MDRQERRAMTATTEFITELFVAGNRASRLTPFEARRLLEQAAATIREMREFSPDPSETQWMADRLSIIEDFARSIVGLPPQLLGHALIDAADMIRTLKTAMDVNGAAMEVRPKI